MGEGWLTSDSKWPGRGEGGSKNFFSVTLYRIVKKVGEGGWGEGGSSPALPPPQALLIHDLVFRNCISN